MLCVEIQHFRFNRILLLAIGLWPYQQSNLVRLQIILFLGILTSFIIFQFATFMTAECTPDVIITVLSIALPFSTNIIEYSSFWINANNIKYLMERLQNICNELKDDNEIAIIKKYGNNAKRYTIIILVFSMCSIFFLFLLPVWPRVLDVVLHINVSKHHKLQIMTEYFIDRERYFYLILLHTNVTICIAATTVTATGTIFIAYIKHICGMFKIASYRIEQAITIKMLGNITLENEIMIYKKIIYAVNIHREAMKFSEDLLSSFKGSFFLLVMVGVLSLSLNFFAVFQNASLGNREESLFHFVVTIVILLYMFLGSYVGQEITDHNNYVHYTTYNAQWYIAPLHAQKLMLFMLQRGSKAFNLNIGGLVVASLECFATLIKASMSYFTVMYSTQK